MDIHFREEQRFTQWWLWLLLITIAFIPVLGIYQQLVKKVPFGDNPMPDGGLILFTIFTLGILVVFRLICLRTTITSTEINIRFFPFLSRTIRWEDIKSAKIVNYGFAGYGIRYGSRHGVIYNTRGSEGLAIEKKNGEKLVIGTQKKDEINKIISQLLP
ncbi:MAG: hypothetical protein WAT19_07495 [Ferruginibacter sp.]